MCSSDLTLAYETNFHGAELNGADLRGANFHKTILNGADLDGADIRYARNIEKMYIDIETNFQNTIVAPEQRVILLEKLGLQFLEKLEPQFDVRY